MGSKKERGQAKRAAKHDAGRFGKVKAAQAFKTHTTINTWASLGARTFPFGTDQPGLEVQRRSRSTIYLCLHGFWLLFMVGTLLALGLTPFDLLSHWVWTVVTVYSALIFAGYWLTQPLEAWLIFWFLLMVHGLLWLQLVLVAVYGVWPGTLWAELSHHSGGSVLMAQMGAAPLLVLPLLAFLAFMWAERPYLEVVFYDFTAQLLPEHRKWNVLWHVCSPAAPLAVWAYAFNPRVFTDLPTWPGVLPVLVTCALCNGTVLMYLQGQALPYLGTVRWLHGVWLVWCKPVRGAAARQDSGWW